MRMLLVCENCMCDKFTLAMFTEGEGQAEMNVLQAKCASCGGVFDFLDIDGIDGRVLSIREDEQPS